MSTASVPSMQAAMSLYCCQNVAIFGYLSEYLRCLRPAVVHVANMPNNRKYCKIADKAARASLSTAMPPTGLGIAGAVVHWPDMKWLCRRVDLFQTRIPS